MLANFHTHTTFCDGKNTPEEMVQAAIGLGFTALGFSGHSTTDFDLRYCMRDMQGYRECIRQLQKKYADELQIFLGVEEDCFAPVNRTDYDYIIGSAHYVRVGDRCHPVDSGMEYLSEAIAACGDPMSFAENYYSAFCAYIQSRKPDIIGHFDLITKYEETDSHLFFHDEKYWQIVQRYLENAMTAGCVFEVNSGAIARGLRTAPYPHERLLHMLQRGGARVILSSDSHSAQTLDCHFAQMRSALREVGFAHTYTLTKDGFVPVDL